MPFHPLLPSSRSSRRSRRRGAGAATARPAAHAEPLEARRLMHAGHDHLAPAEGATAAANPAGSVFVDAGGVAPFTDAAGAAVWSADAAALGGKRVRGRFPVAGTDDDALFASRRQGKAFAYNVPGVADGAYTLSLLFVDTAKKPGKRLFHVDAEGQRLETDLDVVARAGGPRTALVLTHEVSVTGGTFDLALARSKGAAVLSGFSLVPVAGLTPPPVTQPRPQIPAAPGGLAAAAESPTAVALAWSDNSADETGFEVARANGPGAAFHPLVTLPAGATTHADRQGVEPGQPYLYRVRAVNGAGASAWSDVAAVTTPPPLAESPAAPTSLAAQALSPTAVSLAWTDAAGDNDTRIQLERSADGGATFAALATLPPGTTSHLDAGGGLAPGGTYAYRVRAVNGSGASAWSNVATATTPAAGTPALPAAPSNLAAQVQGPTTVALTWTDNSSDETGFVVERSDNGGAFAAVAAPAANATQYADATLSPGTAYAYRVRATNAAGSSAASNERTATTPATPGQTDTFTQVNWTTRAAGPIGRAEALRAVVGGKLYVFAGFSGGEGPVARSDVYDPATDAWTRIADMPRRLTHAGVVADGRDVYFVGGYIGTGEGYTQQFGTVEVWRYNVDADAYARLPDLPAARAGGGAAVLGRTLHYFGGNDAGREDVGDHFTLNLDNAAAGWSSRADLPEARSHMGYAALGGLIYAIGGQFGNDEELTTTAAVHAYDPAADAWTPRASLPRAISHVSSATVVTGGRILVLGGESAHETPVADVYAFDPAANAWATLTPLPSPRFSGVAAAIGDAIYFTTGSSEDDTLLGTPVR